MKRLQLTALLREAGYYRRVRDELCKIVRLAREIPTKVEMACETLKVTSDPVSCRFKYRDRGSDLIWKVRTNEEPPLDGAACPLSTPLQKAIVGEFSGVPSDRAVEAKIAFNFTLASYVNADSVARAAYDQAVYDELFINEEIALDADEFAANSWNALIAEPLNALAAYHASGIKAENVAAALSNLVGLGAIAVGVSQ